MGQTSVNKPNRVVERNIELTSSVMAELLANPSLLEKLPSDFRLVILPEDEPDIWLYNLGLLNAEPPVARPVVFARVTEGGQRAHVETRFYAPLAA